MTILAVVATVVMLAWRLRRRRPATFSHALAVELERAAKRAVTFQHNQPAPAEEQNR